MAGAQDEESGLVDIFELVSFVRESILNFDPQSFSDLVLHVARESIKITRITLPLRKPILLD